MHKEIRSRSPSYSWRELGRGRGGGGGGNQENISVTPLRNPRRGDIIWAKIPNHRWWPAVVISREDCGDLSIGGRREGNYVYWYGHGTVSPVPQSKIVDFKEGFKKFMSPEAKETFQCGVHLAISDLRKYQGLDQKEWNIDKALIWASNGFPLPERWSDHGTNGVISPHVADKLMKLRNKYSQDDKCAQTLDASMQIEYNGVKVNLLRSVQEGKVAFEDICLACISPVSAVSEHPLFCGNMCGECKDMFLNNYFSIGLDLVAFHCSVCMQLGELIVCSKPHCYRSFCSKCITLKAADGVLDAIVEADPWHCFLCEPYNPNMHGLLKPRATSWKKICGRFSTLIYLTLRLLKQCLSALCALKDLVKLAIHTTLTILLMLNITIETLFLCNYGNKEMKKLEKVIPKNIVHLKSISEQADLGALCKISPIHIVIVSCKEKEKTKFASEFFQFYGILSSLNILANAKPKEQLMSLMWIFEASPPFLHENNILISRYLQFDPAGWSKPILKKRDSNLVWTNIPLMWSFLEGDGVPKPLGSITRSSQRNLEPKKYGSMTIKKSLKRGSKRTHTARMAKT